MLQPPCYIKEVPKFEFEVFRNSWICKKISSNISRSRTTWQTAKTSMIVHYQATPSHHRWNFLKKFEISQDDSHVVLALHNMDSSDSPSPIRLLRPSNPALFIHPINTSPRIAKAHRQAMKLVCFMVFRFQSQIHCQRQLHLAIDARISI